MTFLRIPSSKQDEKESEQLLTSTEEEVEETGCEGCVDLQGTNG